MTLILCYNQACNTLAKNLSENCKFFSDMTFIAYDENHYKEKKQAYRVKGGYSARSTPFALLLNSDKSYIKAFYSESNDCTLDSILEFLKNYYDNSNSK